MSESQNEPQHTMVVPLALGALATLLLLVTLFVTWSAVSFSADIDIPFGGSQSFNGEFEYTLWNVQSGGESTSFYDNDMDEAKGISLVRTAIPLVLLGLAILLVGTTLSAVPSAFVSHRHLLVPLLLLGSGVLLLLGSLLFTLGTVDMSEGTAGVETEYAPQVGLWMAYVATALGLGAGIAGFAMRGRAAEATVPVGDEPHA